MLGIAMWASRYWLIIPVLAIAGSLAAKRATAITAGTLPTHTPLFVAMLVGVVLIVGALTFVPALALGPIVEHSVACKAEVDFMTTAASTTVTPTRGGFLDRAIIVGAIRGAFAKLDPRVQIRNPVMFVVYVGSMLTTLIGVTALTRHRHGCRQPRRSCWPLRPGSGSRCCSRTSPKPWPKGAARRKRPRCARCAGTCTPSGCSARAGATIKWWKRARCDAAIWCSSR